MSLELLAQFQWVLLFPKELSGCGCMAWVELGICDRSVRILWRTRHFHRYNIPHKACKQMKKTHSNIRFCIYCTYCLRHECSSSVLPSLSSIRNKLRTELYHNCQKMLFQVGMERSEWLSSFRQWIHMEQKAAIRGDMWDSLNIDIPPFRYKSTVSDLACTGHLLQSYRAVKE